MKLEDRQYLTLDMYTEVNRLKQTFRHIEGIPIPLPVPLTISGMLAGVLYVLLALQVPWGEPITKYLLLPLMIVCMVSYIEPDHMSSLAWIYAYLRRIVRPNRRVLNRAVPPLGYQQEYRQPTIIRKQERRNKH